MPFCANKTTECIPIGIARLISLSFSQNIAKLLQRTPNELRLLPQVGSQEAVCVANSDESGLQGVLESFGRSRRGSVNIINACKLEETFHGWGCDETSTTRSGDKLDPVSNWDYVSMMMELTLTVTEPHLPLSFVGRE
jgi:hypothetical protein